MTEPQEKKEQGSVMDSTGTSKWKSVLAFNLSAVIIFIIFAVWMLKYPNSLHHATREDGPVEYLTAFLFGLTGLGFLAIMLRDSYLKQRKEKWRYFFIICWILGMIFFMGEEISWGQRIFGFETPESVMQLNTQGEFNIHNVGFVHSIKYRGLSLFMLTVGVLIPIVAATQWGREIVQKAAFPVLPVSYVGFFVLSYIYGKTFHVYDGTSDATAEVRELLFAIGLLLFALHGMRRPDELFRIKKKV